MSYIEICGKLDHLLHVGSYMARVRVTATNTWIRNVKSILFGDKARWQFLSLVMQQGQSLFSSCRACGRNKNIWISGGNSVPWSEAIPLLLWHLALDNSIKQSLVSHLEVSCLLALEKNHKIVFLSKITSFIELSIDT